MASRNVGRRDREALRLHEHSFRGVGVESGSVQDPGGPAGFAGLALDVRGLGGPDRLADGDRGEYEQQPQAYC